MAQRAKILNQIINGSKTVTMTANATTALTSTMELNFEEQMVLKVAVTVSGVTVVGAITAKIQHSYDGSTWSNAQSVNVTGDGTFELSHNAFGADAPLWPKMRVALVSTNAGDAAVASSVLIARMS